MYHLLTAVLLGFMVEAALASEPWTARSIHYRSPSDVVRERRAHQGRSIPRHASPYPKRQATTCIPADPANTVTDRLQGELNVAGDVLTLCPSQQYLILAPINFTAPDQEISTQGYPTDDTRGVLVVNGPVSNGAGHTTAIDGSCNNCDRVKVRNIQVNGTRGNAGPTSGGGNLEMGGGNSGQLIEYVHSFDPRSWSCLHIAEGPFTCNDTTVINNDIGPCGTDNFQEWADGISLSCMNSYVAGNWINNPTDGGIVVFGAPGSLVENNTIWVETNTLLGGINMVDYDPWNGNFTNTIVQDNLIIGGFATDDALDTTESKGSSDDDVIIKIGIAIGPRTWFGDRYNSSQNRNGVVRNNIFTGAFGYSMAMSSAANFTVQGNRLSGNTSFIGSRGPNCTSDQIVPTPEAWVYNTSTISNCNVQAGFVDLDADSLTCILPPTGGDYWPFGGMPNPSQDQPGVPNAEEGGATSSVSSSSSSTTSSSSTSGSATLSLSPSGTATVPVSSPTGSSSSGGSSNNSAIALGVGIAAAVVVALVVAAFVRRWMVTRRRRLRAAENDPIDMKDRTSYFGNNGFGNTGYQPM